MSSGDERYGLGTCVATSATAALFQAAVTGLVAEIERTLDERIERIVRERLARGAATEIEWLSQPAAGRIAGVSPQTIREWQASGLLAKGRRGRVNAAELRRFLADSRKPAAPERVENIAEARARRVAASIVNGRGR